jgi:hypothetical protein
MTCLLNAEVSAGLSFSPRFRLGLALVLWGAVATNLFFLTRRFETVLRLGLRLGLPPTLVLFAVVSIKV